MEPETAPSFRPLRLYIAGPLFTFGEQWQNRELVKLLREIGYECFVPQETEANLRNAPVSATAIFKSDVAGIEWSQVIVACIDQGDPDSGTAWELGYAYARNKPALLYRTDFRKGCGDFDGQPVNLMLTIPAREVLISQGALEPPEQCVRKLALELHIQLQRMEVS